MSPNAAAERAALLLRSLHGLARLEVWLFFSEIFFIFARPFPAYSGIVPQIRP